MIYSEVVPWGKGEKHPGEGDEIEPETICLQGIGARKRDDVPIEEWANDLITNCKSKSVYTDAGVGKPSVNSAYSASH